MCARNLFPAISHPLFSGTASLAIGTTFGVAKQSFLFAIKALGTALPQIAISPLFPDCTGSGTIFSVASAIQLVMADCQAASTMPVVLTMSLAGPASSTLDNAVTSLQNACHISQAVAAGNNAGDACSLSPARVPTCLTVGASNPDDSLTFYTNTGSCVDLYVRPRPASPLLSRRRPAATAA